MLGDRLDAHSAARAVAFQDQLEDQLDRVRMQRINLQDLLHLLAAVLGIDDAVADRRQRAVPEALPPETTDNKFRRVRHLA